MDLKEVLKNNSDKEVIYMIGFGFKNYNNSDEPLGFLDGLKIGYSNNLSRRMAIYQRDLLDFDFISIRDGDLVLESAIHTWYSEYRFKIRRLVEWFRDYDYIRDTFKIIPDEVFLRFSKNRYNPRDTNNLYRFGLEYLMKDPDNDFEQEMLWRLSAGSDISIDSLSDISEELIRDIYQFSEKYLKLSLKPIEEVLNNLEEFKSNFIPVDQYIEKEVILKRDRILSISTWEGKMRECCELYKVDPNHSVLLKLPPEYKYYLDIFGISRNSYKKANLEKEKKDLLMYINSAEVDSIIMRELKKSFNVGDKITLKKT